MTVHLFKQCAKLISHDLPFDHYYVSEIKVILSNKSLIPTKAGSTCFISWLCPKQDQRGSWKLRSLNGSPGRRAYAAPRGKTSGRQRLKAVSLAAQQRSLLSENCLSGCFQHLLWLLRKPFPDRISKPPRD